MSTLLLLVAAARAGVLDQAIDARETGDYAGAAALLDTLHPLVEPEEEARWNLERGLVEDLSWNPEGAESYYRAAIDIGGDAAMEARYHLVVVLDDMGRQPEARGELDGLLSASNLNPEFLPVLKIEEGVLDLHAGRVACGTHKIENNIPKVADPRRHAWMIGRGRFAVLTAQATASERWVMDGRDHRDRHALVQRARLLKSVEAQLFEIIHTEEPEWITASLLRVGDTYAALADDLAHAPPPRGLTPEQAEIYSTELARRAEGPRTKAYTLYDHGIAFANRLSWHSPVVEALRSRRDEVLPVAPG